MSKLPKGRQWCVLILAVVLAVVVSHQLRDRPEGIAADASAAEKRPQAVTASVVGKDATEQLALAQKDVAAVQDKRALFTYADPANAAALTAALPAPSGEVHYVRLNAALAVGKSSPFWQPAGAGRVVLPLPGGGELAVAIDGSEMLGADRFTSTGRIEGRPQSRAVFAYNQGFLNATIEDPVLGSFALRTATEDFSQFYRVDPALVPPCGGERRPERSAATVATPGIDDATPGVAAAENPQHAEVHVMMVYTQAVLPTMSGAARTAALQSAFDLAVERVNTNFEASLITARLRLVKIHETQYNENVSAGNKVQDDALTALYKTDDGQMDEIHAVRDQVGADMICLTLNRADFVSSGLAFILDTPNDNRNPLFAFGVIQYGNMAGTRVLSHEFGHILGCAHDRENSGGDGGAYPYSYGYRFIGADGRQYRDIMAYPPGTELSYFSNPNVIAPAPANVPLGIPAGRPGESNNALTIEQNAFAVSTYRLQTQAAANVGTLINVATRAYVGTGDQVLIGGFVLKGTQPKRMLVRAAGPSLAAFGVTNVLSNPLLSIFSGSTRLAQNDNWSEATNAAAIVAATAQSGAFPFTAGSRDAAVLVSLPPGAYTAVVDGVAGATGSGLVEVYDVDLGSDKVVNLATRGYADNAGKEMFGGFVVRGAPGATKRILVRVLGPTLERAPFNITGALFDPYMSLRNAAGETLIENDDWSTGARFVDGVRDDFQPTINYYTEEQISATGFAPSNRREPAVMVDLPPGNYTVIVKPFEFRDSDPDADQPAKPGVGIVEVYEISP